MDRIFYISMLSFFCLTFVNGLIGSRDSFEHFQKIKQTQNVLNKKVLNLKNESDTLFEEIQKIKTSPSYAKKVLKDKYHQLDKHESMVFFDD